MPKHIFFLVPKLLLFVIFFSNSSLSEEKNGNYELIKKNLIKNKLLINSFEKCEEFVNNSSVELFLNCDSKYLKNLTEEQKDN